MAIIIEIHFNFAIREGQSPELSDIIVKSPCYSNYVKRLHSEDLCSSGHQGWGDGAVGSLNPNFTFSLTKNMIRGDQFCEWIIERNK